MNTEQTMEIKETRHLYDENAYARNFRARVLSCREVVKKKEKLYEIVLDQTLFFPEEGGQSPDRGILAGQQVLDVQIRKGLIYHTLQTPLTAGQVVEGCIDWTHRFNNMQQHSGEHIFSGLVHRRFGYDNVGFHLSDSVVTMDFNGPISSEELSEIEYEANRVISSNVDIVVSYPNEEELARLDYRSKIEISGQVRIVTITGCDVCACCAPHVKKTGEIGSLKVMSMQNYKGGVRISILCGFRALDAFREKNQIVSELMAILTTSQDQLPAQVARLRENNQELTRRLGKARQDLLWQKLAAIPGEQQDLILFEEALDAAVMRNTINQLTQKHEGLCALFTGSRELGYNFIIGSRQKDCRQIAAALREKLSARGGGSERMIQGSVRAGEEEIRAVLLGL